MIVWCFKLELSLLASGTKKKQIHHMNITLVVGRRDKMFKPHAQFRVQLIQVANVRNESCEEQSKSEN